MLERLHLEFFFSHLSYEGHDLSLYPFQDGVNANCFLKGFYCRIICFLALENCNKSTSGSLHVQCCVLDLNSILLR